MSTIDELMDKDPLLLTDGDLDAMVAYERKQRGLADAGIKPKKAEGDKKDLSALLGKLSAVGLATEPEVPSTPKMGRRV